MPTNTQIQVRLDKDVKDEAAIVLAAVGLSISDAVRLMLNRVVAEQRLPFELLVPNETTIAAMREARQGGLPSATSFDDFLAQLNADD